MMIFLHRPSGNVFAVNADHIIWMERKGFMDGKHVTTLQMSNGEVLFAVEFPEDINDDIEVLHK